MLPRLDEESPLEWPATKRTRANLVTLYLRALLEEHVAAAFHDPLESNHIKCFYIEDHCVNYHEIDVILS